MFPSRFRSPRRRHQDVLRELPVSSIDSSSNIEHAFRSGGITIIHLSPDRPPRIPTNAMSAQGLCSPVQYLYSTGRTRRRLELNPDMERPMSPTFDDFAPQHASTPGPSSPCQSSHDTRSSRKRHATQTSDYYSQLGSPEEAVLEESVSWLRRAKKARKEQAETSGELTKRLSALTASQLASVISGLVKHHPDLEEDLHSILPEPDISPCEEKISELLHNVYRALPRQRLSSSRSAFCYRRVRLHIISFKKECIQSGRHFLKCRAWDAAIRYVLVAWQHVHRLPIWECPAHNRLRASCFQGLAAICVEALRSGDLSSQALQTYRPRIEAMVSAAPEMAACLQRLNMVTEAAAES